MVTIRAALGTHYKDKQVWEARSLQIHSWKKNPKYILGKKDHPSGRPNRARHVTYDLIFLSFVTGVRKLTLPAKKASPPRCHPQGQCACRLWQSSDSSTKSSIPFRLSQALQTLIITWLRTAPYNDHIYFYYPSHWELDKGSVPTLLTL